MGVGMGTRSRLTDVMAVNGQGGRDRTATSAGALTLSRPVIVVGVFGRRRMPLLSVMVMMMSTRSSATTCAPEPASDRQQTVGSQSDRWTAPVVELTLTSHVLLRRRCPMQRVVVNVRDVRERAQTRLTS